MNTNFVQQQPSHQFQHQSQHAYGYQLPPTQPHRQQPQFSQAPQPVQKGTLSPGQKMTVGKIHVVVEKYLSEGGFAHVYLVKTQEPINGTDRHVLKRVAVREKSLLEEVRKEVEVMKLLRGHPNIVNLLDADAFHLADGSHEVLILMEFCSGGGIIDLMNSRLQTRLTEPEILQIFVDVCEGVAKMHSIDPAPLVHRDLKIENILQAGENTFKICDFGSVCTPRAPPRNVQEMRELEIEIGTHTTLQYRAPEMVDVYQRRPIDEKADIWALGILLYKLAYYTTPFEAQGPLAILNVQYRIPSFPVYSNQLNLLIGSMLQEHSIQRPSAVQLLKTVHALRGTRSLLAYKEPKSSQPKIDEPNLYDVISSVPSSTPAPSAGLNITPMRRGRPTRGDNVSSPAKTSAPSHSKPSGPLTPTEASGIPTSIPKSSFVPTSSFSSTFVSAPIRSEPELEGTPPPLPPRNSSGTSNEENKKEPRVDQKFDGFEDSFDAGLKIESIPIQLASNPQSKQRQSTTQSFSLSDELQQPKSSSTNFAPAAAASPDAVTQPLISRDITSSPSFDERYPSIESLDIQSSSSFSEIASSVTKSGLNSREYSFPSSLLQPSRESLPVILSSSPGPISPSSSFGGDFIPHSGRHLTGGIEKTFEGDKKIVLAPPQIRSAQVTGIAFTEDHSAGPSVGSVISRAKPGGPRETRSGSRSQSGLNPNGMKVAKALSNLTGDGSVNEKENPSELGLDKERKNGPKEVEESTLQKNKINVVDGGKTFSQKKNTDWLTGDDVSPSPSLLVSPTIPPNNGPPKPNVAPKPTSFNRPSSTSSSYAPIPTIEKPSLPVTSPKPQTLPSISPSAAFKPPPVSTTTKPFRPPTLSTPSQTSSILSDQWSPLEAARAKFKKEEKSNEDVIERPDSLTRREPSTTLDSLAKQSSSSLPNNGSNDSKSKPISGSASLKADVKSMYSSRGVSSSVPYGFNSAQPRKLPTIDSESASAFLRGSTARSVTDRDDRGTGLGIRTRPQSMYVDSSSLKANKGHVSSPSLSNSNSGPSSKPTSSKDSSRPVSMLPDSSKYENENKKEKELKTIAAPVPQRRSSQSHKMVQSIEGSISAAPVQPSSTQSFVRLSNISRAAASTVGSDGTGTHVAPLKKALKPVTPENTGGANAPDVVKSRSYRVETNQEEPTSEKKSVQDMINRWNQVPR
ncbi:serine threonine protein [Phaffia rhodozyma]|uniref:non-specific serine/threonine protein kinase n=1 Tax=Phaffia rhodozyma TaxID=264483 RepID=A0A0F7SGY1_PHARH|nr:serine threonine protein [Phaffia rhodozyma]